MQKLQRIPLTCYFIYLIVIITSCNKRPAPGISFYYWKTRFELNEYENRVMTDNQVQSLYIRYFDVDIDAVTNEPKPISVIHFVSPIIPKTVIPVVYIKNRVFEKVDTSSILNLAKNIHQFITVFNEKNKMVASEIQFDCDWTEKTKNAFFLFLDNFKHLSNVKLSATIRLHQVKYSERTGIPPVEEGVLMFYNMGAISPADANSIYEKKNALKYVSSLNHYPLPLNIALPVFSWGIGTRNGKVQYLLNKMYYADFEKDSNFVMISPGRFKAKRSFFKSGYYVMENDEVKVENIDAKDLEEMAVLLRKNISRPVEKLIFYDLDSSNIINYDPNIFQKISQDFR